MNFVATNSGSQLLTPYKRQAFRYYLQNPTAISQTANPRNRQNDTWMKHQALRYFELQDDQVYYKAEVEHGRAFNARYNACYYNAFEIIYWVHKSLNHASKFHIKFIV